MQISICINNLDARTDCTLNKFTDHVKLGGVTGIPDSCVEGSERRMKNCVEKTLKKFRKTKFKVLHLRTYNPVNQYML